LVCEFKFVLAGKQLFCQGGQTVIFAVLAVMPPAKRTQDRPLAANTTEKLAVEPARQFFYSTVRA
jgi:hypothetical protein